MPHHNQRREITDSNFGITNQLGAIHDARSGPLVDSLPNFRGCRAPFAELNRSHGLDDYFMYGAYAPWSGLDDFRQTGRRQYRLSRPTIVGADLTSDSPAPLHARAHLRHRDKDEFVPAASSDF